MNTNHVWRPLRRGRVASRTGALSVVVLACRLAIMPVFAEEGPTAGIASVAYRFKTLNVPGALSTSPNEINGSGQVVGRYTQDTYLLGRAFLYANGVYTILAVPGSVTSDATSINESGRVTGSYANSISDKYTIHHGFFYSGGTYTTLDVPGASSTIPRHINANGEITGYFDDAKGFHGFIYSDGAFTILDVPGAIESTALDIIATGQVLGSSLDQEWVDHGFLFSNGTYSTIDFPSAHSTYPTRMNAVGQIVGIYYLEQPSSGVVAEGHGFLYDSGAFTTLEVPAGANVSANSINAAGQVAGTYFKRRRSYGFVYSGGRYTTLNAPRARRTGVSDINDCGQVAGVFSDNNGDHGFIATPVVGVLDDFSRSNGNLGPNWVGETGSPNYQISNDALEVLGGGPIYWGLNPFGLDQEASVTLTQIDPAGAGQGLLLKVQGDTGSYQNGAIAVQYNAARQALRVATLRKDDVIWHDYAYIPATYVNGDKMRVRVLANGKVRIYRNGQIVGRVSLDPTDRKFFNSKIGRIGLWFEGAPNAVIDDFGGGTRIP